MTRHHFSDEDDALLMKFIATYNPETKGRLGMKLYERLVANAEGKWSFASRHPVHSWRERYKTNQRWFDHRILKYQKKHGISADASSPRATGTAVTGNESKKRAREVDAADLSPSPAKRIRRANVTVEGSRAGDPPSEPRNKGKLRTERSPSPYYEDDPVIGADDYTGALPEGSQSDNESPSPLPPTSPIKNNRSKPSSNMRNARSPSQVPTTVPEESSASSHKQQGRHYVHLSKRSATATRPSAQPASRVPSPVRKLITPPQLSQELTPPHTSALSSPRSPLPHEHSHTPGPSSQSGQSQRVASPKQRRPVTRRIVHEEKEDDIFCTPPIRSLPSSSPPRVHAREAPRLVDGPYRSAYTRANDSHRPAPRGQRASGSREEVEAHGSEWPARRDKRNVPMSSPERLTAKYADREEEEEEEEEAYGDEWPPTRERNATMSSPERPTTKHVYRAEEEEEEEANSQQWSPRRDKRNAPMSSPEKPTTKDVDRSVQHIDLRVLHSRKSVESFRGGSGSAASFTSRTLEKKRPHHQAARAPRSSTPTPPNLTEANKELVLALGLEEVYKRMAENHKFHVDIVRAVAAKQRSLEHADRVLRNMREAAEQEYERLLEQEYRGTGTQGSDEEEEEVAKNLRNEEHGRSALSQPASPCSDHSLSRTHEGMEVDPDAMQQQQLDEVPIKQADSSLPGSPALLNVEWTDDDDELLLDGDLAVHEELVRRKGLSSVKFRTAHLYSLLLDG